MSEPLVNILAVPDQAGISRWQAVAPGGAVAGVASLRPVNPFGPDVVAPSDLGPRPRVSELSLSVPPRWRRQGIGSRLLATVREQADEPHLVVDVLADSPGEAFCRRHGFRHTGSRRHDLLTYCDVHLAWLGELIDAEHPGYRLTYWTGDLPLAVKIEELLRIPSRPGNAVLTAAAADGDLAGYAVAVVGALAQPRARQYGPAVLPDHRGQRLGLWVNAALIARLREVHPYVNEIETITAEVDHHLLAAREQLGFHPIRRTHRYELGGPSLVLDPKRHADPTTLEET